MKHENKINGPPKTNEADSKNHKKGLKVDKCHCFKKNGHFQMDFFPNAMLG